jgi:hypothetical protein
MVEKPFNISIAPVRSRGGSLVNYIFLLKCSAISSVVGKRGHCSCGGLCVEWTEFINK